MSPSSRRWMKLVRNRKPPYSIIWLWIATDASFWAKMAGLIHLDHFVSKVPRFAMEMTSRPVSAVQNRRIVSKNIWRLAST